MPPVSTRSRMRPPSVRPEPTGPGEESVWSYPRPPALEPVEARIRVVLDWFEELRERVPTGR